MKNALLFFVKYPWPGAVKTRLARSIGFEQAARIYKQLTEKNLSVIKPYHAVLCDIWVAFDPPGQEAEMRRWMGNDFNYLSQQGEGLGERFTHAFKEMFAKGYRGVIMLASDTLELPGVTIEQAFDRLQRFEVVIGPAKDGGYYLIGSNMFSECLFQNINWSTSTVLKETIAQADRLKWEYHLLPPLDDLDDVNNLTEGMLD